MFRRAALVFSVCLSVALTPGVALGADHPARYSAGAAGIGDPYFPLDGNGGYDVRHYMLDLKYAPSTDVLTGVATISARATQNLSRFNLDFDGLTVRSIKVNGRSARWSRNGSELTVTPRHGLRKGSRFSAVIRYDGVPQTLPNGMGFIHTDDGALVVGQPHGAATWFPVNDHPIDKAAYTFRITVPAGLEAVANGVLEGRSTRHGWTIWNWRASEPMASYLATATVGDFDLRAYRAGGIRFWDALDPDLHDPVAAPRTGSQYALSQVASLTYKRLSRTISVPAAGAQLSFWVGRETEADWDYAFVEAHTVGGDDWTTLRDLNGHTSQDTGRVCPFWLSLHPFLASYQTDNGDGTCLPKGTTGDWWAATGSSDGYEQWSVDLSAYAGKDVEVSISYASDDIVQARGVFVDDVVVSTGAGTTSFEADGDPFDGWTPSGPPPGSEPNANNWIVGTLADAPKSPGEIAEGSFARQGEIIGFLASNFGRYPFSAGGGIVDDLTDIGFALENQTRPIYAKVFFGDPVEGDNILVHELAHQWYGDSLTIARWQHIWLNEGFATYAEWLWSEREGLGTAQENFDLFYGLFPADNSFWDVIVGDPGAANIFDIAVYVRGAMTLHQLRLAVGDDAFFRILKRWASVKAGGNVTTGEFIRLAERISGQQLDALFQTWLFTPSKPALPTSAAASTARRTPPAASLLLKRFDLGRTR